MFEILNFVDWIGFWIIFYKINMHTRLGFTSLKEHLVLCLAPKL